MNIRVECVNKNKSSMEHFIDTEYCSFYYDADDDMVTARFEHPVVDPIFRLPDCSMTLTDKLAFSENMVPHQKYDCILEIGSFRTIELYASYRNSIRGRFWNRIPKKWACKYRMYMGQQCIEIDGDLILIAPYNNQLTGKIADGNLVEIVPQSPLNIRAVQLIPTI